MQSFLLILLDFIFPPSKETLELRALSPEKMKEVLPKAPPPPLPFITSLFAYKSVLVAELIKEIKNRKNKHIMRSAGYALYKALLGRPQEKIILIPIPISKKRRRERGYNQCELLIDEILKLDTVGKFEKRFDLLVRARHSEDQKLKSREERLSESQEIFTATKENISGPLVLIDDVATTGSTLNSAREALLKAGYADVSALTVAH